MFGHRIKPEFLNLAHIAYGGNLYLDLTGYTLKNVPLPESDIKKTHDAIVSTKEYPKFFSYKNTESGFSASVFQHHRKRRIVIAYRGTERTGMGENTQDYLAWTKDILTDINLITGNTDQQFVDAYTLYLAVQALNPDFKIILVGHSLGGALAQMTAARAYSDTCAEKRPKKLETYTYNAPGCRQLMQTYGCKEDLDYSFITNYAVMNDWCGMYGENIGKTYLISPIHIPKPEDDSPLAAFNSSLLSTHEGIFGYSRKSNGRLIKKPDDFTQAEGLSLWYYDRNNPLKDMEIARRFPLIPTIKGKLSKNIVYTLSKLLEAIARQVSPESLENAHRILKRELK